MADKKHDDDHDEKKLPVADRKPAEPFHGLREPDDEARRELREQDRIRERQQIEAQKPVSTQAGVDPPGQAFPFSASVNEPQTVSTPIPPDIEVPKPAITALNPDSCVIGDADFPLVISGENFFADSVIHFAGHDEPTTFDPEAKTLSTGVKPSLWAEPVVVQVMIRNGPESSDPVDFEFAAPAARRKGK